MGAMKNQGIIFRTRIIAPRAERPATAPNPGAFVVPDAAAGAAGVGDVAGDDTAGLVFTESLRAGVAVFNAVD